MEKLFLQSKCLGSMSCSISEEGWWVRTCYLLLGSKWIIKMITYKNPNSAQRSLSFRLDLTLTWPVPFCYLISWVVLLQLNSMEYTHGERTWGHGSGNRKEGGGKVRRAELQDRLHALICQPDFAEQPATLSYCWIPRNRDHITQQTIFFHSEY